MTEQTDDLVVTCEHCPYWVKSMTLQDITNRTGECRASPPQMIATPIQTEQGMGLNIQSMFPITASKAWCANHPVHQVEQRISEALEVSEALAEMATQMMEAEQQPAPPAKKEPAKPAKKDTK